MEDSLNFHTLPQSLMYLQQFANEQKEIGIEIDMKDFPKYQDALSGEFQFIKTIEGYIVVIHSHKAIFEYINNKPNIVVVSYDITVYNKNNIMQGDSKNEEDNEFNNEV